MLTLFDFLILDEAIKYDIFFS